MNYAQTTQVPNLLFDQLLQTLSFAELKILLIITRQTNGWIDKTTGRRKVRDRISYGQFMSKSNLCRRAVSTAIQSLIRKGCIVVSDAAGNALPLSHERKGKKYLYYQCSMQPVQQHTPTCAIQEPTRVHCIAYNKTNRTQTNQIKQIERVHALIEEIKASMAC